MINQLLSGNGDTRTCIGFISSIMVAGLFQELLASQLFVVMCDVGSERKISNNWREVLVYHY